MARVRRTWPPNTKLTQARLAQPSPSGNGQPMTRQELAQAINDYLWTHHHIRRNLDAKYITKLENGTHIWPHHHYRQAFRTVLHAQTDSQLGFHPTRQPRTPRSDQPAASDHGPASPPLNMSAAPDDALPIRVYQNRSAGDDVLSAQVSPHQVHSWQVEGGVQRPTTANSGAAGRARGADEMLLSADAEAAVESEIQRRTVLWSLSALAVGSPTVVALEALRQGLGVQLDAEHDSWAQVAADYGRAYYTTPPQVLLEQLTADLTVLQQMMTGQTGARRRTLAQAAGQLSVVVAMTLVATGQTHVAARWWQSARLAANDAGDPETLVLVNAWEVTSGGYERRPLTRLIHLADAAVHLTQGRPTAAAAGLHAGRAQALALAGRYDDAVDAVAEVERVTEKMPASEAADVESLFGWPEHRLRHTQSYVHTHAGNLQEASAAQDRALALYPATQARLRTQVALHRASCLIRGGHIPDGLRYAADLLDDLPREHRNAMLYEVAGHVLASVPAVERSRREANELHERLLAGRRV